MATNTSLIGGSTPRSIDEAEDSLTTQELAVQLKYLMIVISFVLVLLGVLAVFYVVRCIRKRLISVTLPFKRLQKRAYFSGGRIVERDSQLDTGYSYAFLSNGHMTEHPPPSVCAHEVAYSPSPSADMGEQEGFAALGASVESVPVTGHTNESGRLLPPVESDPELTSLQSLSGMHQSLEHEDDGYIRAEEISGYFATSNTNSTNIAMATVSPRIISSEGLCEMSTLPLHRSADVASWSNRTEQSSVKNEKTTLYVDRRDDGVTVIHVTVGDDDDTQTEPNHQMETLTTKDGRKLEIRTNGKMEIKAADGIQANKYSQKIIDQFQKPEIPLKQDVCANSFKFSGPSSQTQPKTVVSASFHNTATDQTVLKGFTCSDTPPARGSETARRQLPTMVCTPRSIPVISLHGGGSSDVSSVESSHVSSVESSHVSSVESSHVSSVESSHVSSGANSFGSNLPDTQILESSLASKTFS